MYFMISRSTQCFNYFFLIMKKIFFIYKYFEFVIVFWCLSVKNIPVSVFQIKYLLKM